MGENEVITQKKRFIENVRADFSGMNDRPRKSLARSVETLAADLYKKDTHFVFEMIQNAEDNTYSENITPTLCFKVCQLKIGSYKKTVLIVENNEVGFQEKNVDAVCAVGKSTKTKTQGYIGEKGIGFKSVFKVTRCPYIFSNGYQFSLSEVDEETGLGYIVPQWCEEKPQGLKDGWTSIVIPIDKKESDIERVVNYLKDIAPETILFLEKLKSIQIKISLPGKSYEVEINKDESKSPLTELKHAVKVKDKKDVKSSLYWLFSEEFDRPAGITHVKRKGINSRSVSVAIPLDCESHPGKLFAYLPVWEKTGLPFLINADFILVSSREGVHEDEDWNAWLRDCIPIVYEKTFLSCLQAKGLTPQTKASLYASIPMDSNESFLEEVVPEIQNRLSDTESVQVHSNSHNQRPEDTIISTKRFRKVFVDNKKLPEHLKNSTYLVRNGLEKYADQLKFIGVNQATTSDIVSCLEDQVWLESKPITWFCELYKYLRVNKLSSFNRNAYKKVSIVPVVRGATARRTTLVKSAEIPVYFTCTEETQKALGSLPKAISELIPFSFVSKKLLQLIEEDEAKESIQEWMTSELNVYDFSIENCCVDVIEKLKDCFEELSTSDLLEATLFLTKNANTDFNWDALPIVLSDGSKIPLSALNYKIKHLSNLQSIVVPETYDHKKGWQNIWKSEEDREHFVSLANDYKSDLVSRLLMLGLIDRYPSPKKRNEGYYNHYKDHLAPSWMLEQDITLSMLQTASLLEWVNYCKDLPSFAFVHRHRADGRYNFSLKAKGDAQIVRCLKEIPWLSTTKGYVRPSQAFLPKQDIKEIFGGTVPYFDDDLDPDILELLGICSEVTIEEMLELLNKDSGYSQINIQKVKRIYSELESRTRYVERDLASEFFNNELIYVPNSRGVGVWHKSSSCIWKDSHDLLGDDFVFLEPHYPKLKSFFVGALEVKEQVDKEFFAKRWLQLQEEDIDEESLSLIEHLYREIRPIAQNPIKKDFGWWEGFLAEAKVFTQSKTFEFPNMVVVPDDRELKKIFGDFGLNFVWRPEKDTFNDWMPFYRELEIPLLSESITETLVDEFQCEYNGGKGFITEAFVGMAASWLREKRRNDYERLVEESFFEKLLTTKESLTDGSIKVTLALNVGEIDEESEAEYPAYWDTSENILVYSNNVAKRVLAKVLAKNFLNNKDFNDFSFWIEITLGEQSTERLNELGYNVPHEVAQLIKSVKKEKGNISQRTSGAAKTDDKRCDSNHPPTPIIEPLPSRGNETDSPMPPKGHEVKPTVPVKSAVQKPHMPDVKSGPKELTDEEALEHVEPAIDYIEMLKESFLRKGQTWIENDDFEDEDSGINDVGNVERRGGKLAERYRDGRKNEKKPDERRYTTERTIFEGPDPRVRVSLLEWYQGKCQICGKTWPDHKGQPYFVAGYLIERRHASWFDDPANAICLCADHFAQWRHAAKESPLDIVEQVMSLSLKSEGGDGQLSILFTMKGEDCELIYCEKHLLGLRKLIEVADEDAVGAS